MGAPDNNEEWKDAFHLMLEEGRRAIDQQVRDVEAIRRRAGEALGVAGLAATFFGTLAGKQKLEAGSGWISLALGAFLVVAAAAIFVVLPRKLWFAQSVGRIQGWFDDAEDAHHMIRSAALAHEESHDANVPKVRWMTRMYLLAVAALVFEVGALFGLVLE